MGTETEESTQAPPAASKDAKEGAAAATATEESPPVAYTPAASSTVTSFALDSVASDAVEPTALPAADVGRLAADGAPKPLPADGAPEHLPVESLTDGRMIASIDESSSLEVTVPGAIKAIVKFDLALAQGYLENGNWEALEAYIQKFLKDVQGEKVHMHPGLLCSLYQARVASLVKAGHNATARGIFKDKIEPLVNDLSNPDDILFKPADLEARVKALKNHIEMGFLWRRTMKSQKILWWSWKTILHFTILKVWGWNILGQYMI